MSPWPCTPSEGKLIFDTLRSRLKCKFPKHSSNFYSLKTHYYVLIGFYFNAAAESQERITNHGAHVKFSIVH